MIYPGREVKINLWLISVKFRPHPIGTTTDITSSPTERWKQAEPNSGAIRCVREHTHPHTHTHTPETPPPPPTTHTHTHTHTHTSNSLTIKSPRAPTRPRTTAKCLFLRTFCPWRMRTWSFSETALIFINRTLYNNAKQPIHWCESRK